MAIQNPANPVLFPGGELRDARGRIKRPKKKLQDRELTWRVVEPGKIVLAIDPSIANCGFALVKNTLPNPTRLDSGIWHPKEDREINRSRFDHLATLILQQIDRWEEQKNRPTHAIIEIPAGQGRGDSRDRPAGQLMIYARAIGVCEATCHLLGLTTMRVHVTTWKGVGKKQHTILVTKHAFNYEPRDSNEADALGLGMWLCYRTLHHG